MAEAAAIASGAYGGYRVTTSVWAKLTKHRHKVSFGSFLRSIEKKEHVKLSKASRFDIELDLRSKEFLITDSTGHKWVLPRPVTSY